jgi:hypothetical protein
MSREKKRTASFSLRDLSGQGDAPQKSRVNFIQYLNFEIIRVIWVDSFLHKDSQKICNGKKEEKEE